MKKRIIAIAAVLMMLGIPAKSQVFMMDDDADNPRADVEPSEIPYIPLHGEEFDQGYVPVGGGAALLIGFGAAYLLAKRKK